MTTSADAISSLEASFPTSPPTVLDVAGENLPVSDYLVGASSVVSSLGAWLGFSVLYCSFRLAMVVLQDVLFRRVVVISP
jgi:hypothetical protein